MTKEKHTKSEKYKKYIDKYDSKKYIVETDTHIEAKGGDGTLLKSIKMHRDKNKPFFGIGAGTVNFLMNTENAPNIKAKYKKFNLIKVLVTYRNKQSIIITEEFQAFNDVVIGEFNGWIGFDCEHKENILGKFMGSGMIICTSQGSTGINKNNNGSIMPLSSKNWGITGMQCNRTINYIVKPKRLNIGLSSRTPVKIAIDGNENVINNVLSVDIFKGDKVTVIFNEYSKFKEKRQ